MVLAGIVGTIFSFEFAMLFTGLALLLAGGWGYYRSLENRNWGFLCGIAALLDVIVLIIMLYVNR